MARPRKNAAKAQSSLLTVDGVQEDTIPVEEQPYPLPEGWKWVKLEKLYQINPRIIADDNTMASFVPMEKIEPGMKGTFTFEILPWGKAKKGHTQFADGDVAFAKISPCFENGKSMLVHGLKNGLGAGTTELIILRQPSVLQKYTFYLICSSDFIQKGTHTYSGTVGQQRISMDFVRNYPVPLPPFDEQKRIVDRIESLFAKLDEAREKAKAVLDGFESRKAAILHKAFTGDLTAKWRKENNIQFSSWKQETIASLCHSLKYGTAKKSKKRGSTIVLRMGNLQSGEIDWSDLAYSDDKDDIQKYLLSTHDVLFNRTNSSELVGKTSIYRGEYPAIYAGYLIKMDYKKDRLAGLYLNYVMNSHKSKEYCKTVKSDGVNQSNINAKKLGAFIIPVPSLHEQHEITRILDSLFAKEQRAKEAAENVLNQIELIKKAILAKAFRGELTRNVDNQKQR